MRTIVRGIVISLLAGVVGSSALAADQPDSGPRLAASLGGAFGDGGTAPTFGFSVGYAFKPYVGVEFELGVTPSLDFGGINLPVVNILGLGAILPSTIQTSGRIVTLLFDYVAEIPTGSPRVGAYLVAGGGIASVTERF